jgi:hypothetical protein
MTTSVKGVVEGNVNPLGYQRIVLGAGSTALTVPAGARLALFIARTAEAFMRDDGVNPTATDGFPLPVDYPMFYSGDLAAVRFTGAGSTLHILYYN